MGKPTPIDLGVRLKADQQYIKKKLALVAKRAGLSTNAYIVMILKDFVDNKRKIKI